MDKEEKREIYAKVLPPLSTDLDIDIIENKGTNNGKTWNQNMIHVVNTLESEEKVKIAILDSGINFNTDISVVARKNFIPNDERSILYEDPSGHGTAVAGIIGALDNDEGITGVNPGVELYSARILDSNLEAPVERVVEAIDWAIEQDVDIINMSFGIARNVNELEAAIRRAADAGILLVAAVGDGQEIAYPAAYNEVIAVGAVNAEGIPLVDSASGSALELMAPGDNIISSGIFGGVMGVSGTSIASPHVVGAASVLMELNPEMPAEYIRALLNYSANLYGSLDKYGNGVIDLEYAITINDKFKKVYNKHFSNDAKTDRKEEKFWGEVIKVIPQNENAVETFTDVEVVQGKWGAAGHEGTLDFSLTTFTEEQMYIITYACNYPDDPNSGLADMDLTPFHGFLWQRNVLGYTPYANSNYVMNTIFLTWVAKKYGDVQAVLNDPSLEEMCSKMFSNDLSRISSSISTVSLGSRTWVDVFEKMNEGREDEILLNNDNKRLFLYGMTIHMVGDVFAHSTWTKVSETTAKRIKHPGDNQPFQGTADDPNKCPQRYAMAQGAIKNIIFRAYYNMPATASDFVSRVMQVSNGPTNKIYLGNFMPYLKIADPLIYENNAYNVNQLDLYKCSLDSGFGVLFEGNTPYPEP